MTLRVALVAGPMYDHLYKVLEPYDVSVDVHADHPTLNARVAELLDSGERLDLISTHSKYAPSQRRWLRPLDDVVGAETLDQLAPGAVELCRFEGSLLCIPRLIDVRVMWVRADRVDHVPDTWAEVESTGLVFGFTGRESGLFGLFFELVIGAGGRLFTDDARPVIDSTEAEHAVETIVRLAQRAPEDLVRWHYDDVDAALLNGRVDAAAAWPGGWGPISRSALADVLRPYPYPAGTKRRVSYAGCHAWAIPTTCGDVIGAVSLLSELSGRHAQLVDALGGNMSANVDALASVETINETDRRRLEITRSTIENSMITYPPLVNFPIIETAGWTAINGAVRGRLSPSEAIREIQRAAQNHLSG